MNLKKADNHDFEYNGEGFWESISLEYRLFWKRNHSDYDRDLWNHIKDFDWYGLKLKYAMWLTPIPFLLLFLYLSAVVFRFLFL